MGRNKKYIKFDCDYCGKENERLAVNYKKKSKHHFCDIKCRGLFVSERWAEKNKTNCSYCNEEFSIPKRRIKRSNNNYCSLECKHKHHGELIKGVNHPRYIEKHKVNCGWCSNELERYDWLVKKFNIFFCDRNCQAKWLSKNKSGENAVNWRGGINPLYNKIRTSDEYMEWRHSCMKRDSFTCQDCEDDSGGNLNVHHKITFKEIMEANNIESFEDALSCDILWDINNGITLCVECHIKEHRRIKDGL